MGTVELVSNGAVMAKDSQHAEKIDGFCPSLPAEMILLAVFLWYEAWLLFIWQLRDIGMWNMLQQLAGLVKTQLHHLRLEIFLRWRNVSGAAATKRVAMGTGANWWASHSLRCDGYPSALALGCILLDRCHVEPRSISLHSQNQTIIACLHTHRHTRTQKECVQPAPGNSHM